MKNNIKKDYLWNTIGVLFQNALSPLLIVVVTRVNGIDDSGIFSFAFSLAILFWALAMWGGRTYQVSDTKSVFKVQSYIVMRITLGVVIFVAAGLFCVINNYDVVKTGIILTLVLLKVFESIADAIYGVMQVNDKLFIAGKSLLYKSIASIAMFVLLDAITQSVLVGCVGIVLVNIAIIIFYDIPKVSRLQKINIKKEHIRIYFNESLSIMHRTFAVCIVSFLAAFSLNIPRYFLDARHPEEIGYFGIIAMPVTLVVLLMTFILQPNIVNLARQLQEKKFTDFGSVVKKIILSTFIIGGLVIVVTYFVGVELLTLVFGVDFSNYKTPLMIITTGAIGSALVAIFINMLTIMRKLTVQLYVLLFTNVALIAVCLIFIKDLNINGSVSLFALTSAVQAVLLAGVYIGGVKRLRYEKT